MALRWAARGWMNLESLVSSTAVYYLAFVAAPVLIMALMLTTRPRQGLALLAQAVDGTRAQAVMALARSVAEYRPEGVALAADEGMDCAQLRLADDPDTSESSTVAA